MVLSKEKILCRDGYSCQKCGKTGYLELAHRAKQGKGTQRYIYNFIRDNYNVYLKKKDILSIMHDSENLVTSCPGCNSSFNLYFKPVERDALIKRIYEINFIIK